MPEEVCDGSTRLWRALSRLSKQGGSHGDGQEVLASVKRGKPPVDCAVIGTWKLRSYVRERLSDGQRHNQFGEAPDGYIGYAPDGRMYAIFTRNDRVAPRDIVPTDEEGVQLLGTMVAYAGTFSLGENVVVHHIDTSWNQAWTGTDQIRHLCWTGDVLTITTAPYKSYLDGLDGTVHPGLEQGAMMTSVFARGEQTSDLFALDGKHVLVTGGSSGLGRHFAAFLAKRGAEVTVAARRAEALAKTVDDIGAAKGQAQSVVMDVTAAASIESALDAAETRFGPIEIRRQQCRRDRNDARLLISESSDWDKVLDTNLKGVWLVAQAAGRRMAAHKRKAPSSISPRSSAYGLRARSHPMRSRRLASCK